MTASTALGLIAVVLVLAATTATLAHLGSWLLVRRAPGVARVLTLVRDQFPINARIGVAMTLTLALFIVITTYAAPRMFIP